jgi:hypothetical protein
MVMIVNIRSICGDKIAEIHRNRFANDPALAQLVENLGSYEGSGTSNASNISVVKGIK